MGGDTVLEAVTYVLRLGLWLTSESSDVFRLLAIESLSDSGSCMTSDLVSDFTYSLLVGVAVAGLLGIFVAVGLLVADKFWSLSISPVEEMGLAGATVFLSGMASSGVNSVEEVQPVMSVDRSNMVSANR